MTSPPLVVYSAICGDSPDLPQDVSNFVDEARFLLFTDRGPLPETGVQHSSGWTLLPAVPERTGRMRARWHKLSPHMLPIDPEAITIWVDGCVAFKRSPRELVKPLESGQDGYDLAAFKHPDRKCLYDEGAACLLLRKDDPAVIHRVLRRYREESYPAWNGLIETGVLVRRPTRSMRRLNELWWQEIVNGSCRDQLSFNYVAWKLNFRYGLIPGTIAKNDFVRNMGHGRA